MKVNELMIGDYIRVIGNNILHSPDVMNRLPCITKITSVNSDDFDDTVEVDIISDDEYFNIDEVEPILLTKEILEKNDFKPFKVDYEPKNLIGKWWDKTGSVFVKQYCLSNVSYRNGHTVFMVGCGVHSRIGDIVYVHQLQHALKLCGIEKEIVL